MVEPTPIKQSPVSPNPVKNTTPWIILGGVLVLGVGLALGYLLFKGDSKVAKNTNTVVNRANRNTNSLNANLIVNGNLDVNEAVANINAANTNSVPTNTNTSQPVVPEDLTLIDTPPIFVSGLMNNDVQVYDTGALASTKYAGKHLLLFIVRPDGPYFQPLYYRVVKDGSRYTLIALQSDDPVGQLDPAKYTSDAETLISELDYPLTLQGPEARQTLELVPGVNALFDSTNLKAAFTDPTLGAAYTDAAVEERENSTYANGVNYGFYFKAPDGTIRAYKLKLDFLSSENTPNITWADGSRNHYQYDFTDQTGCGSANYTSVVSADDINIANDLSEAGVTAKGDKVYTLRNTEHAFLRQLYERYNPVGSTDGQDAYSQFIENRPMIFFVDVFDRLVKGHNSIYQPLAECGKPVIYLYPQKTTDVSVKVAPSGGFSKTEPAYNDGWNVAATPNGQLTEIATGAAYPYLFWEGRSQTVYPETDRGFVVAQAEVHGFLVEKLAKLGLNEKETADFVEFWEPRMQGAPYYFVTFLGKREMDQLAPLTVSPKPDTIIRLLMDFRPLQQPIEVKGYDIRTPERKGFTVVEWGGVLR